MVENCGKNVSHYSIYLFSMLSLGRIVISDLVVVDLFVHSLFKYHSTLLGHAIFYIKGIFT